VSPVTTYKARSRAVYLPAQPAGTTSGQGSTRGWTDHRRAAPYDAFPLHVKAGSIIPTGPEIMYTDEKPADPIVLWVYAGADGEFTLYEDDGLSYGYEKGASARIPNALERRYSHAYPR
jgi:alpha-D-xyloside xylohydrolase